MRGSGCRHQSGIEPQTLILLAAVILVLLILGIAWVAVALGAAIDHTAVPTRDPFGLFFGLLRRTLPWPRSATWIATVLSALIVVTTIGASVSLYRRGRKRSNIDSAAPFMARGRDLNALSTAGARTTATRLGVKNWLGVPIGITVAGRRKLYGSPEDMHVDIWGPRTGKTTSRAIPAILSAPGPVLVTSNKRDVLDATRDVRESAGSKVWAFDPQQIALEQPTWWWNPLSYVTDDMKAARLAEHFACGSRTGDSRVDPYFDNAGQDLLAGFLLAAALDGSAITRVFTWTTTPGDDTPVGILRAHGYDQMADSVAGQVNGESRRRTASTARQRRWHRASKCERSLPG